VIQGFLGKKIGVTQVFRQNGHAEAVTAIEAGPCVITQLKTTDRDGYNSVQIGFGNKKNLTKPISGHLGETGSFRYLREVQAEEGAAITIGQKFDVSLFSPGEIVNVRGISIGRGFAGGVKRHGFHGGPKTHGQSDRHRAPGSIGAGTTPGRVLKGQKMAGHMGNRRVTVKNLEVIEVDPNRNLLLLKGVVPGSRNGLLVINKTGRGLHE
jgi:large subunit ribosomal protein L3